MGHHAGSDLDRRSLINMLVLVLVQHVRLSNCSSLPRDLDRFVVVFIPPRDKRLMKTILKSGR